MTEGIHNKWGVLNNLVSIVNEGDQGDARTALAEYFLQHFGDLDDVNIYDAAAECYTTRAAIRRFCLSLGFDNFKAFKQELRAYRDEGFSYYSTPTKTDDYPALLASEMMRMLEDCNAAVRDGLDQIVAMIHHAKNVTFVVSDLYTKHCSEFQKQMILNGKMVHIVGQRFDDSGLLQSLGANDLVIVVSTAGFFEGVIRDLIQGLPARKMLMTARHDATYEDLYDFVIHLCAHDLGKERTVYHVFAVEYCLLLVANEYMCRYAAR